MKLPVFLKRIHFREPHFQLKTSWTSFSSTVINIIFIDRNIFTRTSFYLDVLLFSKPNNLVFNSKKNGVEVKADNLHNNKKCSCCLSLLFVSQRAFSFQMFIVLMMQCSYSRTISSLELILLRFFMFRIRCVSLESKLCENFLQYLKCSKRNKFQEFSVGINYYWEGNSEWLHSINLILLIV